MKFFNKNKYHLLKLKIEKRLKNMTQFNVICFPALRSTQDTLKDFAAHGANEGCVLIADSQSGGRGREGRSFFSPSGSGIYMSFLLRPSVSAPDLSPKKLVCVTSAAAVAVAESIEKVTGKKTGIKWVNDILHNGLKVSGILTEAAFNKDNTRYEYIVVGIGINLFENSFPSELQGIAGALFSKKPLFLTRLKVKLISEILNRFSVYYGLLARDDLSFVEKYRLRSVVIGKRVDIIINDKVTDSGTVLALNDDFSLNVKTDNGKELFLSYGEVRIKINENQ